MARRAEEDDALTIPVVEEQAEILKRRKVTGAVRVRTVTHEDEELVEAPVVTETVEVERVPVDRWVEAPVPVRQEGDTTIVSLHEEIVVIEKRLKVTEEVRITRHRTTGKAAERVTLRREEALVEHLDAPASRSADRG